jgi:hypothetical protein
MVGIAVGSWGSHGAAPLGRLCLLDAVPYLSDELVDPLWRYAELSSRFASSDGWLEKAEAL